MAETKPFRWTVEIEVAECWVADGFNPSAEAFRDAILGGMLGYARTDEVKARIVKAPDAVALARARGEEG